MRKQRLLSRLCAACRWMPDAIFCFHFWLRFCRNFNRWSHILLHFQHHRLASNMSLTMNKIPQFGSMSVMKVSSARSNQWWFLTCPKVIAHANRLMDAAYHPSCFFCGRRHCLSTGHHTWGLPADQRGIEPPPVVCYQLLHRDALPIVHLVLFINIHASIRACFPSIAANQGENDFKEGAWFHAF